MVLKFKNEVFDEAKTNLQATMRDSEATEEQQSEALNGFFDAFYNSATDEIRKQVNNDMQDRSILQTRGQNVLTSEERKFYNEVATSGGFDDEDVLPITTQERVFEDLKKEHPLLTALNLQDLGAVTRFIFSDPEKAYKWGKLFGDIQGQIQTAFDEKSVTQLKLTAFAVIPKDLEDLGPEWVEEYVRTLIVESYSVGLEHGYVNGNGDDEPIGLTKDTDGNDKNSSGTLTFAPSKYGEIVAGELYEVVKKLSKNEKGNARNVGGKVVMVVNPLDAIGVQARNTIQTANGQWVTALPYNIEVVESEAMEEGKAAFFVKDQYIAIVAGDYQLQKFEQTLAIEDANLYTIKRYANGFPRDNKAAVVYDLDIKFNGADEEPGED